MSRILDTINSPVDVKKLTIPQLETLAQEIREELITVLSKNGGHIGPNLGVVELTIALHYVFETPEDHFTFDVSHQAYVHKLLTGRRDRFHTIRQPDGLNGFMLRTESPHDSFGAGHAGTALSSALGMATARDLRGGKEHVIALCGDAAFTCGVTFEALNNVKAHTKRLITILNDNEWSIDKNVGAIADYLNSIATHPKFKHLHDKAEKWLQSVKIGDKSAWHYFHKVEEGVKGALSEKSTLFEELGITYYGPIDGHNLELLIKTFEFLKKEENPVLLHVLTKKGKGFEPAIAKQKKFHGAPPFDPETGETKSGSVPTYSEVFADTLVKLADSNNKVVAITGAMPNGTCLDRFQPKHPDKYFDVGIAEEHAVLFAAGLATKGYKPFCAIYSTFLQRAYDMIIHDVCLQNLPVVFCMDRGSLSGDDGPTHHGLFDISYLRCVPNMVHFDPKDEDELADMLFTAMHHNGPIAIRYPRGVGRGVKVKDQPQLIPIGKAEVLKHGQDVAIFALGSNTQDMAKEIAAELEKEGRSVAIINPRTAKPIDTGTLEFFARSTELIITLEDHVIAGGFGSAVIEELNDRNIRIPVVRGGWPDQFIDHGKEPQLREKYSFTAKHIIAKARPYLQKKSKPAVA